MWQFAVDPAARGRGVAALMLHGLVERLSPDVQYVDATVTPSNEASQRTFRKVARDLDALCNETVLFPGERFGGPSHEDEVLFRIGPIDPALVEARRSAREAEEERQAAEQQIQQRGGDAAGQVAVAQ